MVPLTYEAKPKSDPNSIPLGVKMTDDEIVIALSVKMVSALMMRVTGMSQAARNDVGIMWTKYLAFRMKYGAILKTLIKKEVG